MAGAWQLSGDYFENCNCSVVFPCLDHLPPHPFISEAVAVASVPGSPSGGVADSRQWVVSRKNARDVAGARRLELCKI